MPSVAKRLPADVRLDGSRLTEQKTEADLSGGTFSFSKAPEAVLIYNTDASNDGVFTVNGVAINVPASNSWGPHLVSGAPSASVTVTGSTAFIAQRFE